MPAIAGLKGSTLNVSWSVAELGPAIATDEQQNTRLVLADEGRLGTWDYRLGFVYGAGQRDSYFVQGYLNGPKLQAGVLSGVLNPFGTQTPAGLEYLKSISADGGQIRHTTNVYTGLDLTLTRELMQLKGGALTFATGAEFHHDGDEDRSLDRDILVPYQNRLPNHSYGNRNIAAVFAEVDLPLTKELDIDLAVRGDRYSDFGGTVNPKAQLPLPAGQDGDVPRLGQHRLPRADRVRPLRLPPAGRHRADQRQVGRPGAVPRRDGRARHRQGHRRRQPADRLQCHSSRCKTAATRKCCPRSRAT